MWHIFCVSYYYSLPLHIVYLVLFFKYMTYASVSCYFNSIHFGDVVLLHYSLFLSIHQLAHSATSPVSFFNFFLSVCLPLVRAPGFSVGRKQLRKVGIRLAADGQPRHNAKQPMLSLLMVPHQPRVRRPHQ